MAERERASSTVHLTRIYTRTGDDGTTALGDMSRVRKTALRVAAYGDVDEANCAIGVALAGGGLDEELSALLTRVQNELFDVGADLCSPIVEAPKWAALRIEAAYVEDLETACDDYNSRLATLDSFILPGGTPAAAALHVARTVTRRAERAVWALIEAEPDATNALCAAYLNRLSDLLFILGRVANTATGDRTWSPRAGRPGSTA
jgi:cob(I)alamin adenosyltransferase